MQKFILLISVALFSFANFAHDNESGITLESKIPSTSIAGKIHYTFDLYDNTNKKNLSDADLMISHENLLHLFVFDLALKEFRHVHPVFSNYGWSVDFDLQTNGSYMVWAQATSSNGDEFSTSDKISIVNGKEANNVPSALGDVRSASEENSVVNISGKVKANKSAMLMVKFSRNDDTQAEITDYLGAFAHIVAVPLDGSALIHVHPMATGIPNEGMIHATFPKTGDYRLWIQFVDGGKLRKIPLSIKVQ